MFKLLSSQNARAQEAYEELKRASTTEKQREMVFEKRKAPKS